MNSNILKFTKNKISPETAKLIVNILLDEDTKQSSNEVIQDAIKEDFIVKDCFDQLSLTKKARRFITDLLSIARDEGLLTPTAKQLNQISDFQNSLGSIYVQNMIEQIEGQIISSASRGNKETVLIVKKSHLDELQDYFQSLKSNRGFKIDTGSTKTNLVFVTISWEDL